MTGTASRLISFRRRSWLPAVMCGGVVLLIGCAAPGTTGTHGRAVTGPARRGIVQAALQEMTEGSERITLGVTQAPGQGSVAAGSGTLTPATADSDILMVLSGGGFTQIREVAGAPRLQSFNTAAQRANGQWVSLSRQVASRVLAWPPGGEDDPTFAFVTADWPKVLADNLISYRFLGHRSMDGIEVGGYELHLRLFKPAPEGQAGPQLDSWIDGAGQLRFLTLDWPVTVASAGTAPSGGAQGTITITIKLSEFTR
jgi:hypothetical protein